MTLFVLPQCQRYFEGTYISSETLKLHVVQIIVEASSGYYQGRLPLVKSQPVPFLLKDTGSVESMDIPGILPPPTSFSQYIYFHISFCQ